MYVVCVGGGAQFKTPVQCLFCDVIKKKSASVFVANVGFGSIPPSLWGLLGPRIHYPVPACIRKEKRTW